MKFNEGARKVNKYVVYTKAVIWIMILAMIGVTIGVTMHAGAYTILYAFIGIVIGSIHAVKSIGEMKE